MKLALVVAMACCGSNVVGPLIPKPKVQYVYESFLWSLAGRDMLTLQKMELGNMLHEDHAIFFLPGPCRPIPKELQ